MVVVNEHKNELSIVFVLCDWFVCYILHWYSFLINDLFIHVEYVASVYVKVCLYIVWYNKRNLEITVIQWINHPVKFTG
jgi:hypothetical protein